MYEIIDDLVNLFTTIYNYLTTNLSAARAAKIDNLDGTITSRAAASTALSNNTWTDGLAALIRDGGIPGTVKSIQTGFFNGGALTGSGEDLYYADVTVTSVTPAKCCVIWMPHSTSTGENKGDSARLTSATNLRISSDSQSYLRGRYQIIEYY